MAETLGAETKPSALSLALRYAEKGISVFPCNPLDKTPLVKTGFKAATTDQFRVRAWWTQWPNAMIGAPTGKLNGFVALDIDNNTEKGKYGLQSIAEFGHPFEELSDGPHTQTAGGGYHIFYAYDDERPIRNSRGNLPTFIDIRGEGGYVILAGSQTADGRSYRAILSGDDADLPPAPEWLHSTLSQVGPDALKNGQPFDFNTAQRQQENAAIRALEIPPGQWHDRTRDLVARMVKEGASDETIIAVAPGFTEPGYTHQQTISEFLSHARTARQRWGYQPTETDRPPAQRFRTLSISDLAKLEPPEWRIDGIFPTHGTSALYGPYGSFKSFVALDMAMSLATGRPWHEHATKPCKVLYVVGEGQFGFAPRALGWCASKKEPETPNFRMLPEAIALPLPGETDSLLRMIDAEGFEYGLIVFDTLTRMSGGGSLNDEKDVQAYVRASDRIRIKTGAHVMHIGHSGKDSERGLMGSVVLPAAMETIIAVERKGMSLTLTNTNPKGKQKDGPEFEDKRFALRPFHYEQDSRDIETLILTQDAELINESNSQNISLGPLQANLLAVIKEATPIGGAGFTRLKIATGSNQGSISGALKKMEEKGLIQGLGEDGLRRWVVP